ncbi:MAG: hypothetical protein MPJ78_03275 [Hyphomicrobiaceae bacterium]|nr:hypothetical protein [Hyphomicrobiaceae bacterium]
MKMIPALLISGAILLIGSASPGSAQGAGYVTAYSDYGNGQVSAPVRHAQFGYQVKLPGGPWIYCQRNSLFIARIFKYESPCADTLRRQSIDFWETQQEDQGGSR